MKVFDAYAKYYDLLYQDKNYDGEALFVSELIEKYAKSAKSLLELGCGTGAHAEHLARRGYTVHGVDCSQVMLELANKRRGGLSPELQTKLDFEHADIRSLKIDCTFDVVLSLFHVMSYQVSNDDLLAAFSVARAHLQQGGLFVFDCWYGPGVLSDLPQVRVKRMEDGDVSIIRTAEPVMYPNENLVDVNYQVVMCSKDSGLSEDFSETHRMRYLFRPELEQLLTQAGFNVLNFGEWMSDKQAGFDTWSVYFVAKAC